MTFSDGMV